MPALSSTQRAALEKTVITARRHADTGARNALQALAVDQPEPSAYTSPEQHVYSGASDPPIPEYLTPCG